MCCYICLLLNRPNLHKSQIHLPVLLRLFTPLPRGIPPQRDHVHVVHETQIFDLAILQSHHGTLQVWQGFDGITTVGRATGQGHPLCFLFLWPGPRPLVAGCSEGVYYTTHTNVHPHPVAETGVDEGLPVDVRRHFCSLAEQGEPVGQGVGDEIFVFFYACQKMNRKKECKRGSNHRFATKWTYFCRTDLWIPPIYPKFRAGSIFEV